MARLHGLAVIILCKFTPGGRVQSVVIGSVATWLGVNGNAEKCDITDRR